ALGVMVGLLAIDIHYHPQNALTVINFVEHLFVWATHSDPELGSGGGIFSMRLLLSLAAGLYEVFAHATFVLHPSSRACFFLQWFIFSDMYIALERGPPPPGGPVAVFFSASP